MRSYKKLFTTVSLLTISASIWLSSCYRIPNHDNERQSEVSQAESEYLDQLQNGDHGIYSDDPFTSDLQGVITDGVYINENIGFEIAVPEGFESLSVAEMQAYKEEAGTYRMICDPDNDRLLVTGDCCYDLMLEDANGNAIRCYYRIIGNLGTGFLEGFVNRFIQSTIDELSGRYDGATVTAGEVELTTVDGQPKYIVTYEIADGDLTSYRTEIIDFTSVETFNDGVIRTIAVEYSDPTMLDEVLSGINYTIEGTEPVAD